MSIGSDAANDLITTVRTATANRKQLRTQLGNAIDRLQRKINTLDAQETAELPGFAAANQAAFNAYLASQPEPDTAP